MDHHFVPTGHKTRGKLFGESLESAIPGGYAARA
jgi:hypothetical protein